MNQINREEFGRFLAQKRKAQNLTQKQLEQRLFVSDKAVSKWERGLSLPDIELLTPLAEVLEVTVTELLQARDQPRDQSMSMGEVEKLVTGSLALADGEKQKDLAGRSRRLFLYLLCAALSAAEISLLLFLGLREYLVLEIFWNLEGLSLFFGGWFWLTRYTRLPAYYDQNAIGFVSAGILRLHLAGVRFNNRNWPSILRAGRIWGVVTPLSYPLVYGAICKLFPQYLSTLCLVILLIYLSSLFIPLFWAGRKYA